MAPEALDLLEQLDLLDLQEIVEVLAVLDFLDNVVKLAHLDQQAFLDLLAFQVALDLPVTQVKQGNM